MRGNQCEVIEPRRRAVGGVARAHPAGRPAAPSPRRRHTRLLFAQLTPCRASLPPQMPKKTETFKVEKLVDMRLEKGKKLFLVKWKGYPASQNTWEPVGHLDDCKEEMKAFEKKTTKSPIAKKAAPAKKSPTPAKKEAKRPKTANTRAMTTKPKRAPKAAEVKEAAPAKKAAPPKAKPATFDIKQISALLMATIAGRMLSPTRCSARARTPRPRCALATAAGRGQRTAMGGWQSAADSQECCMRATCRRLAPLDAA